MKVINYVNGQASLGQDTYLGLVHLRVKNLKAQVEFYKVALRLTLIEESNTHAILGDKSGHPLLYLRVVENAKRYGQTSGLYHFALLYPNEKEFAKAVAWLFTIQYQNSPTDHGFSKTTYLKDLEGNDIELYVRTIDRAEYVCSEKTGHKIRYRDGRITDGRDALDLDELFKTLTGDEDLKAPVENLEMGHVHLYGYDVKAMQEFYTKVIGYAPGVYTPEFMMSDVGLNSEENHVIAFNSWKQTTTPAPLDAVGLDYFTLTFQKQDDYNSLLARLAKAGVELVNEKGALFIFDPSDIKIKLELKEAI